VVSDLQARKAVLEDEPQKTFADQQRVRENMKALLQGYTRQLNERENRLGTLSAEGGQVRRRW
jgi:hypothetical protein